VTIIRAFGASARFMVLQIQRVDKNITFYYYLWAANRWLSVRFSLLSAFLVGGTGLVMLLLSGMGKVNASVAGFALSFALQISNNMLFLVRRYTALELAMVGVERVKE
jgi:ABC-type multidrug transport system fused ATPase/permease subunit